VLQESEQCDVDCEGDQGEEGRQECHHRRYEHHSDVSRKGEQESEEGGGGRDGVDRKPTGPGWTNDDTNVLSMVRDDVGMRCRATSPIAIWLVFTVRPNA